MSKAFTKEDVEPPERSGASRSASGLPPRALNYITPAGAARLREELAELRRTSRVESASIKALEEILACVTIVETPAEPSDTVPFGATVLLRRSDGQTESYRVVGVDELRFEPNGVTWISPLGRALLAARRGDRVALEDGRSAVVEKIGVAD